ncbi:MAG: hypothetical protein ACLTG0_12175 [Oscillibacter sp.]
MMENNSTPSPDPIPEASPIAVPVPAESAVTPPPAPPVIPLRERPNAPLLHKGFQNLFRLGIANIVINLLNNTFKLGDKDPGARHRAECDVVCGQRSRARCALEAERGRPPLPQGRLL